MNPEQLSQFASTFAQLSQQVSTMSQSIELLSKQLATALNLTNEPVSEPESKKPKLNDALKEEVYSKLSKDSTDAVYQSVYCKYAAKGNVEACKLVYEHSRDVVGQPTLMGPLALNCLYRTNQLFGDNKAFEEIIYCHGLDHFPNGGAATVQHRNWLKSCGLSTSTLDQNNKYKDSNVLLGTADARSWLPYYLWLYVFNHKDMTMFRQIVDWRLPIIKDKLDTTLTMIFQKFVQDKSIDNKSLDYVDWMLCQAQVVATDSNTFNFTHTPSFHKYLTENDEIKSVIIAFMNNGDNVDKLVYRCELVLALFKYLCKRVYKVQLQWELADEKMTEVTVQESEEDIDTGINQADFPQLILGTFGKLCRQHKLQWSKCMYTHNKLSFVIQDTEVEVSTAFTEAMLNNGTLNGYLATLICIQYTQAVCGTLSFPTQPTHEKLISIFTSGSWMKKFKFISDILPIEMWQTAVDYQLVTLVNQPFEQVKLINWCLRLIYSCLISHITFKEGNEPTEPVRFGNNIKSEMTSWFSFICHMCNKHNIKLTDLQFLVQFWKDMIQFARDIRWFIYNCAVKWSASTYLAPLIEALKMVTIDSYSKCLARDTMYLIKKIQKGKYTVDDYLGELLEDGSSPDLLKHLRDLDEQCKYDFKSRQMLMYHACVGVCKGGSREVIKFLANKGLEAWEDNITDLVKHMNVNQLLLLIACHGGKYEEAFAECYDRCAKNGWTKQAMWLHDISPNLVCVKDRVLIPSQALALACEHNHPQFVDNIIDQQHLHHLHLGMKYIDWARSAGVLAEHSKLARDYQFSHGRYTSWAIKWFVKYILDSNSSFDLFTQFIFHNASTIGGVIAGLFEHWTIEKCIDVDKLKYVDWLLVKSKCFVSEFDHDNIETKWLSRVASAAGFALNSTAFQDCIKKMNDYDEVYYPNVALLFKYILDTVSKS